MQNHYLKAETADALRDALLAAGILVAADSGDVLADGAALDVIGTIHKPTGAVQTVDGMEVLEMAAVPGWHANLRGELSDTQLAALEPILLEQPPAQPYRVWA